MSAAGNDNNIDDNANANNIIFSIKDTKLFVPVVTLLARENQEISKLLSKGFEYKTKSENKNSANEYRYFLESNFVGVDRLFVLVYSNKESASKIFKVKKYYLPKDIMKNYNVIINGKNFYE